MPHGQARTSRGDNIFHMMFEDLHTTAHVWQGYSDMPVEATWSN